MHSQAEDEAASAKGFLAYISTYFDCTSKTLSVLYSQVTRILNIYRYKLTKAALVKYTIDETNKEGISYFDAYFSYMKSILYNTRL